MFEDSWLEEQYQKIEARSQEVITQVKGVLGRKDIEIRFATCKGGRPFSSNTMLGIEFVSELEALRAAWQFRHCEPELTRTKAGGWYLRIWF